ncbi:vWA domain-containing protein [Kribbella sp. NPDC000426]|uniref:vWA domain-containing protein n=1 Tax=Kribbella sp. NPDC000426 TaxID=3154255 RepID=UPI00331C84C3
MTSVDSRSCTLVVVPASGPIAGNRIGLPTGSSGGAGVLRLGTGHDAVNIGVQAIEVPEVPADYVAVAEDLAADWDIGTFVDDQAWQFEQVRPHRVRRIVLELPTEREPADVTRDIAHAGLAGTLLWTVPDTTDLFLSVNGVPHRVLEIDVDGQQTGLVSLSQETAVELYASSVRAGVDVVVLADISNSMTVDDLPVDVEGPRLFGSRNKWITRIDALKQALQEMLDIRLQVSGRVSRLALLEFNQSVRQKFPRGGGMAQLDGSSPDELVTDFRHAIALLRPEGATDIGNALHEAANLLYQHGRPGNEKLIVLVSDGANWTPSGEQGTGEIVHTVKEPVSLVAHLHRDVGIRLHAIGISTAELFHRRGKYQPSEAIVPNHTLLEELVKVGGGDPTTVGGLDVLAEYFTGLGGGITHRVSERLSEPSPPGPMADRTRAALTRLHVAGTADWDKRRDELRSLIADHAKGCNDQANRAYGRPLWSYLHLHQLLTRELGQPTENLKTFIGGLTRGLHVAQGGPPFDALRGLLEQLATADAEYAALGHLVGAVVDSPPSGQVLIMQRVNDELLELHNTLAAMPAVSEANNHMEDDTITRGTKSGFIYRD